MCIMCVATEYVTLDEVHTHTHDGVLVAATLALTRISLCPYLTHTDTHTHTQRVVDDECARCEGDTRVRRRTCRAAFVVHDTYVYYVCGMHVSAYCSEMLK